MTSDEAVSAVVDALNGLDVPYMVVGSFSSNYYGIPPSTQDADFVIELGTRSIGELANRLGVRFRLDPQAFETVTLTRKHELEVVGSSFKIELFHLSDDAHDQERFRRRQQASSGGRAVTMPTAEDVIITKLRWITGGKRNKDWEDVRDVVAVQGERIDWEYVNSWCERHGTRVILDEIRKSIPAS
jgi:hypothetical protein